MSADLLLEIGCEEIPSRYLTPALEHLKTFTEKNFREKRVECGMIKCWATPRRIVLMVEGVSEKQEDINRKVKGPPADKAFDEQGEPTRAALGFAGSAGVDVSELGRETVKGVEYLMASIAEKGLPVRELLPEMLKGIVSSFRFPRSMYWQEKGVRFARPVRWLLALLKDEVIEFEFAGIEAGNLTRGHRFLSEGNLQVKDTADFFKVLQANHVILDQRKRKEIIMRLLQEKASELNGKPAFSEELLEEVSFLVEHPWVVMGSFSEDFLKIPSEVLITSMQSHQRFFPVVSGDSTSLLPWFLGISNNRYSDYTRRGYEKVLRARLADAEFFFGEDTKETLERKVEKLKKVVYQETLGTLYHKTERIISLTHYIGRKWGIEESRLALASRAALLSKADLVTDMVKEFPELQGVMGREYALISGENRAVASAVYEHYLPRFTGDEIPGSAEGTLVSLADKLDTLAGCFYAGLIPTGSQDPYALRRQALGAAAILLNKDLPLSYKELLSEALSQIKKYEDENSGKEEKDKVNKEREIFEKIAESLNLFMEQRIRYLFQEEKDLSHDITDAVLKTDCFLVNELFKRAITLKAFRHKEEFPDLMAGFTRVNNLSKKAVGDGKVRESLFREEAERKLWEAAQTNGRILSECWQKSDHEKILLTLSSLRGAIDLFFDAVMVMDEDIAVRENRLSMLLQLKKLYIDFADFSVLQS